MKHQIKVMGSHASISKVRYLFSLPTRVIAEKFHFENSGFDHAVLDTSSHVFNVGAIRSINRKIGNTYVLNDTPINHYGHMTETDIKIAQKINDYFMSMCNLDTVYPEDYSVLTIDFPAGFDCPFLDHEFFEELVSRIPYICVAHASSSLKEDITFYSKGGQTAGFRATLNGGLDGDLANYYQHVFSNTRIHEDILGKTFNHHSKIHHYAELFSDSMDSDCASISYGGRGFSTIDSFLNDDDGRFSPEGLKKLLVHAKDNDKVAYLLGTSFGITMSGIHVAAFGAQMKLNAEERAGLVNIFKRSGLLKTFAVEPHRPVHFDTQAECRAKNLGLINTLALYSPALAQFFQREVEVPSISAWHASRVESRRTMKNC